MIATIRQLYALVRPSGRRRLAVALAVVAFQAGLQTVAVFSLAPFLSAATDIAAFRTSAAGRLFERLFGNGTDERLVLAAGLTSLVLLVSGNLFAIFAELARSRYAQSVGLRLRNELLKDLLERKYTWFLNTNSSALTKYIIEDVSNVAIQILMPALEIASRILLVIMLVVTVVAFEPVIVLAGVVMIGAYYVIVMRPVRRHAARASDVIKDGVRRLYFEVQQVLGAIKPIFASDQREYFVRRVDRTSEGLAREVARLPLYTSIPRSGLEMVMFGSMIGWVVALILSGQDFTATIPRIGIIAVVAYRLLPSIQMIFANMGGITAAHQSLDELVDLMRQQSEQAAGIARVGAGEVYPLQWQRDIRLDALSYRYPGADVPSLAEVTLVIAKGSRVAFVGPTGSGKSTLVDILLGLLVPTGGSLLVDGRPLGAADLPQWRRTVGYVPQDVFLLDGTIAENIAFGHDAASLDRSRVMQVATIAQADDFIERRSATGLDAIVGERGAKLSGGQRQRLALARALYHHPDTLIMDEATSALDPVTERKVIEALSREGTELTVVTVAHRMSTIRDYDVIHFMEHGRVQFSGTFDDLLEREPRFREFVSHSS